MTLLIALEESKRKKRDSNGLPRRAQPAGSNDEEEAARADTLRSGGRKRDTGLSRSIRMRGKACARARTTRASFRSTVSVAAATVVAAATAVVVATATTTAATTPRRRRRLAGGGSGGNDASVAAPAVAAAGERRRCVRRPHTVRPATVVEGVRNHADAVSGAHHVAVLEALERAD